MFKTLQALFVCITIGSAYGQAITPAEQIFRLGKTKWTFKTQGKIFASPLIANETTYIGSDDGNLYALDAGNGNVKWTYKTGGAVHTTPAHHKNVIYFGSFDGNYYAINADTGKKIWSFQTGGEKWIGEKGYLGLKPDSVYMSDPWEFWLSSPLVNTKKDASTVYFGSSDGNLYAVNAVDGKLKWKFRTNGMIHNAPCLHDNTILVGSWDTFLYAVDAETGALKWKFKTGDQPGMSGIQASPVVANGMVYFGARDANFYALDFNTGDLKWKFFADNAWVLSNAVVKDNTVYFGTSDTFLVVALDAATGKEKWRTALNGYVYATPSLHGKTLFVGDFTGRMYGLNSTDGKITSSFSTPGFVKYGSSVLNEGKLDFNKAAGGKDLSLYASNVSAMEEFYKLGSIVSAGVIHENHLYVGSADGNLYVIEIENER